MRIIITLLALIFMLAAPSYAQDDPRYSVSMRWMRDGSGSRVGMIYEATNRTDEPLCLSVRSSIDNLHGGIVAPTVLLPPHARRVRIASFMVRFTNRSGESLVLTQVEPDCGET